MVSRAASQSRSDIRSQRARWLLLSLLASVFASPSAPAAELPALSTHQDLSYFSTADQSRAAIHTGNDWQHRRADILAGMQAAMGPLPHPERPVPLDVRVVEEHREEDYICRKIAYHTDDSSGVVKAWLLIPANKPGELQIRLPAMLCLHQTTPHGKDSPVGLSDRATMHYASELAKRSYVTLSPDYPSFGEYRCNFSDGRYQSGTMRAIYDNVRAIDLLQSLPEVDADRIGCIGHSLGGHNALFTAVFDERIKAVVTSCGFTAFHKYKGGDLHGWSSPRYMPLIGTKYDYSPDRMPFDFAEVLAAIAPRAVFVNAPLHDDNFEINGVRECLTAARPIFELLRVPNHLQAVHPDGGHDFTDIERGMAYKFLDNILKPRR
ncbi:MAG TPA: alpha/beta fold hydrolase [Lacipirellulaceae bacterium]|nr:alpha/beta fold hydrolase [Lacipirellulaceae bacterium]